MNGTVPAAWTRQTIYGECTVNVWTHNRCAYGTPWHEGSPTLWGWNGAMDPTWACGLDCPIQIEHCRTVGRTVGLSELSNMRETVEDSRSHVVTQIYCRTPCRTVGYCRTVGLSDCRIVGILSDCRNTVGYCRTLLSDCRTRAQGGTGAF
jgi:hypothetical protein